IGGGGVACPAPPSPAPHMPSREGTRLALPTIGPTRSLADEVADSLRDTILSGRLPPGERLNEVRLAPQLGTARGPVGRAGVPRPAPAGRPARPRRRRRPSRRGAHP